MDIIILSIITFLTLIKYIIFLEIILSWLILFGVQLRIEFIQNITNPLYLYIKKIIPTTIGPMEFAPIIVIIFIEILISILITISPSVLILI